VTVWWLPRPLSLFSNALLLIFLTCVALLGASNAVSAAEVIVRLKDLQKLDSGRFSAVGLALPPQDPSQPIVAKRANDAASMLLRSLDARGLANGFNGVLYDNRDNGHSRLKSALFPRLTHLAYSDVLQARGAHYGLAGRISYPAVVIGNSSTAITGGPFRRTQTRLAMTSSLSADASAWLYRRNHLYVYPSVGDYKDVDRYPAYWPYHVVSFGKSGSDKPFLKALFKTLAAFQPKTIEALKSRGLAASTLQMILRRHLKPLATAEDYLGPQAHRPVLDKTALRPKHMVAHAAALSPEDLMPQVVLKIVKEDFKESAGLANRSERLFDTPSSIARIWRGFNAQKEMLVNAYTSDALNAAPLRFSWRVLNGDPNAVKIEPNGTINQSARITVDWHLPPGEPISTRIDIGVFVSDGQNYSAPSVISISLPLHQDRRYTAQEGEDRRLVSIDYDALGRQAAYDPALHWSARWRDEAVYDASGIRVAWRREFGDSSRGEAVVPVASSAERYVFDQAGGRSILEFLP